MAIKSIYHDHDYLQVSQIKNVRQHNLTTAQRTALGADLTVASEGLFVWDTDEKLPYVWDGDSWVTTGGVSAAVWGNITGNLADQADLQDALDLKVDLSVYTTMIQTLNDEIDLKLDMAVFNTFESSLAAIALSGDYSDLLNVPINTPDGIAGLDGAGKIPVSLIPSALLGAVIYQGGWNATSNNPALASGTGTKGWYYLVTTPGSTNLDGINEWKNGDWAIFDGAAWGKVDNTSTLIGSGTANKIAKWSASNVLADSIITDDGSTVSVSGKVKIGANPASTVWENLGVNNGLSVNYNNTRLYLYNDGNILKFDSFNYDTNQAVDITIADNGGKVFLANSATGKVGIGTANPLQKLVVTQASDNTYIEIAAGTGKQSSLLLSDRGNGSGQIRFGVGADYAGNGSLNDFYIYDYVAGQPRIYIAPGGNVGIGRGSADVKLDVDGALRTVGVGATLQAPGGNYTGHTFPNDQPGDLTQIGTLGSTYPSGVGFLPRQGFIYSSAPNGLNLYSEAGGSGNNISFHTAGGAFRMGLTGTGELNLPGYTNQPSFSVGAFLAQSYGVNNNWMGDNMYYDAGWKLRQGGFGIVQYNTAGGWGLWATNGVEAPGIVVTPRYLLFAENNGDTTIHVGDLIVKNSAKGLILTAPDSTRWRLTVDNAGTLSTALV